MLLPELTPPSDLAMTNPLTDGLIRNDAKHFFKENLARIYEFWMTLSQKTNLPPNIPSTDLRVMAALREHAHITSKDHHSEDWGTSN